MSQKVAVELVVDSSRQSGISDSDSDLDLTDTNLLPSEDEVLKKYIPAENTNDADIVVFSDDDDDDDDLTEIELTFSPAATSDPPDYESPVEDVRNDTKRLDYESPVEDVRNDTKQLDYESPVEDVRNDTKRLDYESPVEDVRNDTKRLDYESPVEDERNDTKQLDYDDTSNRKAAHFDQTSNADCEGLVYDELLAMCGQDAGNDGDSRTDDDDKMFHDSVMNKVKVDRFKQMRVAPYSIKGKGKQLVSGTSRCKSSANTAGKLPATSRNTAGKLPATSRNKEHVFRDSAICYGEGSTDTQPKVEEKPVPPPPMMCEACSKAESHNSMVQCCDSHVVCTKCVGDAAKLVLVGEKKGSVGCPRDKCSSSVPLSELRKALPAIVLDLLEDKWNKEALEAVENMKDSVTCPGCGFKAVLDMNLKHFQCLGCNQAYCRYCDYKWKERKNHELCIRTKQWTSTVTGNIVNIPAQWTDSTTDSTTDAMTDATGAKTESFKAEELATSGEEFCDVVHYMNKYMSTNVKKVFRIQNERLWEKYSLTRSHMIADLGELNINEKRLFHGTYRDVIEPICKEGFDWRLCGKHGTVYGQGTYFARSPVTSHRYSAGMLKRSRHVPGNITGHTRFPMFSHGAKLPKHYKPALRFGAPVTTQSSGFTFGTPSTVSSTDACSQQYNIGTQITTRSSGFIYGNTSLSQTGFNFGTPTSVQSSVFRFTAGASGDATAPDVTSSALSTSGGTSGSSLSAAAGCNPSSVSSSTTDAGSGSCSNCIFCSHTKKSKNSDDAVTNLTQTKIANVTPSLGVMKNDNLEKNILNAPNIPTCTDQFAGSIPVGWINPGDVRNNSVNIYVQKLDHNREAHQHRMEQAKERLRRHRNALLNSSGCHVFANALQQPLPFHISSGSGPSVSGIFGGSGNPNGGSGNSVGNNGNGGNGSGNAGILETESNNNVGEEYFMFLARVLVGRSCTGTNDMRRPGKDSEDRDTHSAVDSVHRPSVFVIFDNTQCYPEYIIQYSTSAV